MTITERVARSRAAQGFGPTVDDPAVLARVAAVVLGNDEDPGRHRSPVTTTTPLVKRTANGTPTV